MMNLARPDIATLNLMAFQPKLSNMPSLNFL